MRNSLDTNVSRFLPKKNVPQEIERVQDTMSVYAHVLNAYIELDKCIGIDDRMLYDTDVPSSA
jgi:hypothetical protein